MECAIEERLDYSTTRAVVDGQRQAIVAKVNTLSNAHVQHDGLGGGGARRAAGLPTRSPGWPNPVGAGGGRVHRRRPAAAARAVSGRRAGGDRGATTRGPSGRVSTKQAPDYYEVVKGPIISR